MDGKRSIPQLLQALKRMDLRSCVGKHMKVAQFYQAFNGQISVDEIKSIQEFLSNKRQGGTSIDPDDFAEDVASNDRIDMDDLIDAIQFRQDFDEL